jgi:hypothetical protein
MFAHNLDSELHTLSSLLSHLVKSIRYVYTGKNVSIDSLQMEHENFLDNVSILSQDDVGKIKLTGYFQNDVVSYTIDYKSFHEKYVKAYLLFKPQPRGIFDWYKVCVSNPATSETTCQNGWWYPGWSYARMTIEIPAHY